MTFPSRNGNDCRLSLTLTSWNHHRASVHLSVKLHMSLTQIMILLLIFFFRRQNNFQHLTQTSDRLHQCLTVILTIWFKLHSVAVPKTVTGQLVSWAAWYCQVRINTQKIFSTLFFTKLLNSYLCYDFCCNFFVLFSCINIQPEFRKCWDVFYIWIKWKQSLSNHMSHNFIHKNMPPKLFWDL